MKKLFILLISVFLLSSCLNTNNENNVNENKNIIDEKLNVDDKEKDKSNLDQNITNIDESDYQNQDVLINTYGKDLVLSFEFPKYWHGNYEESGVLSDGGNGTITEFFEYIPKNKDELAGTLFILQFVPKESYEADLLENGGSIPNMEKIGEFGNGEYYILVSRSINMPYTEEEDIVMYSKMIGDVNTVIKSMKITEK